MAGFSEASTIQAGLADRLSQPDLGWEEVDADDLDREETRVLIESEVREALLRFNPVLAEEPSRADLVLSRLRGVIVSVIDEGLIESNERMIDWLRGLESIDLPGVDNPPPIRLIDFDNPRANRLVVSREVTYHSGVGIPRRFDLVLWVNGFPLVICETKSPSEGSWLNAAKDINEVYEVDVPAFFVPNVFSFATEGKELKVGAIGAPPEIWQPWSSTADPIEQPSLKKTIRSAELLLTPENVLDILRSFTLYSSIRIGEGTKQIKIIARYPQVEAVKAITQRAADSGKKKGLVVHTQGSGKTFIAAFACGQIRRAVPGATVLVVLDRIDLIEQTGREFTSAGIDRLSVAENMAELREMLSAGKRGVILTTVFRFKDAGLLTDRDDIIVLVDEAHRTQEGSLGMDMREAIPNATYFGMTGTAISEKDRDTYRTFGDPDDSDQILSEYTRERSIADGATLPLRVEAPKPDLQIDTEALDEAFDQMAVEAGLTDEEKEVLAKQAGRASTLFKSDARIEAICADIVEHFYSRIDPIGMKAQVVCFDRELCVLYEAEIKRLLEERGSGDECAVVMTVASKGDPAEWRRYDLDREAEEKIKARFRDPEDPLKFLIVTAKLLTGFDAPIEGVMYLDKPLRKHTLSQALDRTNRRWINPETGQEKTHGLIVDYVGLGKEIAEAMQVKRPGGQTTPLSTGELKDELRAALAQALARFDGIDLTQFDFEALSAAQDRLADSAARDEFAEEFLRAQALFELLWPDPDLRDIRDSYRWLAKVYGSIQPAESQDALLWDRLGAKTMALINEHVVGVRMRGDRVEHVTIDEESLEALKALQIPGTDAVDVIDDPPTAEEILDGIEERLKKRLAQEDSPKYRSLAERLDRLRQAQFDSASDSIDFLKRLLDLAREVVAADREVRAEATEEQEAEEAGLLPEQRIGALTEILKEYKPDATPEIINGVVEEIDAVVMATRFSRWQTSREGERAVKTAIRKALNKFGVPPSGQIFDKAYDYVAEHY
jgi:type I restriction enzyme R subunit